MSGRRESGPAYQRFAGAETAEAAPGALTTGMGRRMPGGLAGGRAYRPAAERRER